MRGRRQVLVIGYYGDRNAGDEAILSEIVQGLREDGRVEIVVPCYGPDLERLEASYGVNSFPMEDLERTLQAVETADLVLVGGGGLLHDIQDPRPETMLTSAHFGLSYYCGVPWLAGQLGVPVMLYAVGVGPLRYAEGETLVRDLCQVACAITVRDQRSADLLRSLGAEGSIEVTADPAWRLLPPSPEQATALLRAAGAPGGRWLGVAVRNWDLGVDQVRWEEALLGGMEHFAAEHGLGVLLLPFQHGRYRLQDDVGLAHRLAARLTAVPKVVVADPCTAQDLLATVGQCDLVVAMRLHSLIFACMMGTPVVALGYDDKVALHAGETDPAVPVLPLEELTAETVYETLGTVWASRLERVRAQRALAARMRRQAERNMEVARSLLAASDGRRRIPHERIFSWVRAREEARRAGSGWTLHDLEEPPDALESLHTVLTSISRKDACELVRIIAPRIYQDGGEVIFGGAERYLLELGPLLRRFGAEVEVVQPADEGPWERHFGSLPVRGLPVADASEIEQALYLSGAPRSMLTIHLVFASAGPFTLPPALGISHGVFWDAPYYQAERGRHRWFHERLMQALLRLDAVVAVDTNTINWVASVAREFTDRTVHIPNFVNLEEFRPVERSPGQNLVVLFPRRLVEARGFWVMAEIIPDMLTRYPHLQFHLVGHASGAEKHAVQELVRSSEGRVRWDVVDPARMPEIYRAADIVVIPTLFSEGTSLACLEAQASGRPVVATRVGGLSDLILEGDNGLLVEPEALSIRAAIEQLVNDPSLRRRLAVRGLETVREFDILRWRKRWDELLATFLPRAAGA